MLIDSQNNQYILTKPRDSTIPRADHHFIKVIILEMLLSVFFFLNKTYSHQFVYWQCFIRLNTISHFFFPCKATLAFIIFPFSLHSGQCVPHFSTVFIRLMMIPHGCSLFIFSLTCCSFGAAQCESKLLVYLISHLHIVRTESLYIHVLC